MESPEDIEKKLHQLIPPALSDEAQRDLEGVIDHLASGGSIVRPVVRKWGLVSWCLGISATAAAVTTFAILQTQTKQPQGDTVVVMMNGNKPPTASELSQLRAQASQNQPSVAGELPVKVVKPQQHSASMELPDGILSLRLDENGTFVSLKSQNQEVIYEGPLLKSDGTPALPQNWQGRAQTLGEDLKRAISGKNLPKSPNSEAPIQ